MLYQKIVKRNNLFSKLTYFETNFKERYCPEDLYTFSLWSGKYKFLFFDITSQLKDPPLEKEPILVIEDNKLFSINPKIQLTIDIIKNSSAFDLRSYYKLIECKYEKSCNISDEHLCPGTAFIRDSESFYYDVYNFHPKYFPPFPPPEEWFICWIYCLENNIFDEMIEHISDTKKDFIEVVNNSFKVEKEIYECLKDFYNFLTNKLENYLGDYQIDKNKIEDFIIKQKIQSVSELKEHFKHLKTENILNDYCYEII